MRILVFHWRKNSFSSSYIYIYIYELEKEVTDFCAMICTEEASEMAAKYLHNKKMCF